PEPAARYVPNHGGTDRQRAPDRDELRLQLRQTTNPLATFLNRHVFGLVLVDWHAFRLQGGWTSEPASFLVTLNLTAFIPPLAINLGPVEPQHVPARLVAVLIARDLKRTP